MKGNLWFVLVMILAAAQVWSADFYVSPVGQDSNLGTKGRPFASIEAARDAVRARIATGMDRDLVVQLAAGDFFIEKPVVFDDRDGGRDGCSVIYRGAPNLGTRIYGGKRITEWKKMDDSTYESMLSDKTQHYTLYENDHMAIDANRKLYRESCNGAMAGMFYRFEGLETGQFSLKDGRLTYAPRNGAIEDQTIVLGTTKDVLVIKGRSMQQIAQNIVFDGLYMIGSDFAPKWKRGATFYATWDGMYDGREWGGKTLGSNIPAPDMMHGQFYIENARGIKIVNSKLYGAGFMGVMFHRWAQDNVVENCWIEHAGCNGLFFLGWECGRGPFKTVKSSYVNKNNRIRNNVFYAIGRFAYDGGGVYLSFSGDNVVEHNIFHGITRYGVAIKGWRPRVINYYYHYVPNTDLKYDRSVEEKIAYNNKEVTYYDGYVITEENQAAELLHSRNNLVRYNDFSQISRAGHDQGMIEMWGAGQGNVWEYNACHDGVQAGKWDHWMHVLFNDDGAHNTTIRGNIIYWNAGGKISRAIMSKSIKQFNINNIFADCDMNAAATIQQYVEPAGDMVWSNNIIASQFAKIYHQSYPVTAEDNVYQYRPMDPVGESDKGEVAFKKLLKKQQSKQLEQGTVYADPLFDRRNPWWGATYTDYKLRPDSPALKRGFKPIPMELIGLRNGYPFDVEKIFAHPAQAAWKAANYSRIYKARIYDGVVCARYMDSENIAAGSWVRYDDVNFGSGDLDRIELVAKYENPLANTFVKKYGQRQVSAAFVESNPKPEILPLWEVSPIYKSAGKAGVALLGVPFAAEANPDAVAWKPFSQATTDRGGYTSQPGEVDIDAFHGEENSASCAYLRSSLHIDKGRTNADFRLDCETGAKVWLNDELILNGVQKPGQRILVVLNKGWNTFVVKVAQGTDSNKTFRAKLGVTTSGCGKAQVVPGLPENFVEKSALAAPEKDTQAIELRLDAPDGALIGTVVYGADKADVKPEKGKHDLFMIFPDKNVKELDWYQFSKK